MIEATRCGVRYLCSPNSSRVLLSYPCPCWSCTWARCTAWPSWWGKFGYLTGRGVTSPGSVKWQTCQKVCWNLYLAEVKHPPCCCSTCWTCSSSSPRCCLTPPWRKNFKIIINIKLVWSLITCPASPYLHPPPQFQLNFFCPPPLAVKSVIAMTRIK